MNFYDGRAMDIASKIYAMLKDDDKARGDKLADMFKAMMRFNDIVIDCASKLAPYQSSKLESIEVKKTVEHRFVVRAPEPVSNTQQWLNNVQMQALPPPVLKNSAQQEAIEDVNDYEDDYEIKNTLEARP